MLVKRLKHGYVELMLTLLSEVVAHFLLSLLK